MAKLKSGKKRNPGTQRYLIQSGATVRISMIANDRRYRDKIGRIIRIHRNQAWVAIPEYPSPIQFSRRELLPV